MAVVIDDGPTAPPFAKGRDNGEVALACDRVIAAIRPARRRPRAAPAVAAGARSGQAIRLGRRQSFGRNNSGSLAMFTAMREAFRG